MDMINRLDTYGEEKLHMMILIMTLDFRAQLILALEIVLPRSEYDLATVRYWASLPMCAALQPLSLATLMILKP